MISHHSGRSAKFRKQHIHPHNTTGTNKGRESVSRGSHLPESYTTIPNVFPWRSGPARAVAGGGPILSGREGKPQLNSS